MRCDPCVGISPYDGQLLSKTVAVLRATSTIELWGQHGRR
jgi:hypothetical protein